VIVNTQNPKNHWCHDTIFFANSEYHHLEPFFFHGRHVVQFEMPTEIEQADVGFNGISVFSFCDGIVGEVESLFNFLKCFVGGLSDHPHWPVIGTHVPEYQEKANLKFLTESMEYTMEPREKQTIDIDPDLIKSGDYVAIMRLDGLDQIIMYGTGSHSGHSVMALRFDGELFIVESQDAWYWPTHGLQRTPWAKWIKQAEEADFHVTWCPLSEEAAERFDEKAAQDFFFETEGLPYGYHNFLYGWIDTANNNWPPLLAFNFAPIMFSLLEKVVPNVVFTFFTEALNFRLGTKDLNISEITAHAAKQNMSLADVMAMNEQDGWVYYGEEPRDGLSMVCSAYVAAVWKAAGMFGDNDVNATEFSPKDVYVMNFFESDPAKLPQECQDSDDQGVTYCQIRGKYKMTFPYYNTVAPYQQMFQSCSVNWPTYEVDPNC